MMFLIFLLVVHFLLGIVACYMAWSFNNKFGYNLPGHPYAKLHTYVLWGAYAYVNVVIALPREYFLGREVADGENA